MPSETKAAVNVSAFAVLEEAEGLLLSLEPSILNTMKTSTKRLQELAESRGHELVTIPGFDEACMGYQLNGDGLRLCYSVEKMEDILIKQGHCYLSATQRILEIEATLTGPHAPIVFES